MMKLFAIMAVLATAPLSALAAQTSANPLAVKCAHDAPDVYAQAPAPVAAQGQTNDANIAR